jgi:hypothetical protein
MKEATMSVRILVALLAVLCVSGIASAQLSKDDAKCINAMNKNLAKIASTMGKEVSACVKNFGKGQVTGIARDCLTADVKGKLAKATGKTGEDFTKKCSVLPAFGVTDPNTVNRIAIEEVLLLANNIFGADRDLNLVVSDKAIEGTKEAAKCQAAVIKAVMKCQDARLKSFNGCKKDALKGDVTDPAQLAACIGDDAKGKISKACGKISDTISKKCSGRDLVALFPGCNASDPTALADCLNQAIECHTCGAVKLADGVDATCSACIPSGPLGDATCTSDSRAFCVGGPFDGEPCTDALQNQDCGPPGDRGNCLMVSNSLAQILGATPLFDLPTEMAMGLTGGTPDPNTGIASVQFQTIYSVPIDLGPVIGIACIETVPFPGCGEDPKRNRVDCDGGEPLDYTTHAFHALDDCGLLDDPNETDPNNLLGPSECRTDCEAHCAGLDGDFVHYYSACEGYCQYGDLNGKRCANDVDCVPDLNGNHMLDPNEWLRAGRCPGGEPVAHPNKCNCTCVEIGGRPSSPGGWVADEPLRTTMEPDPPCDFVEVMSSGLTCNPRGTRTVTATMFNNNAVEGVRFDALALTGLTASCQQHAQGNMVSTRFEGYNTTAYDSGLGDMFISSEVVCVAPE